jgi:hypothetical protein
LRIGRGVRVIGAATARLITGPTATVRTTAESTTAARLAAEPADGASLSGARTAVARVTAGRNGTPRPVALIAGVEVRGAGRAASNCQAEDKGK